MRTVNDACGNHGLASRPAVAGRWGAQSVSVPWPPAVRSSQPVRQPRRRVISRFRAVSRSDLGMCVPLANLVKAANGRQAHGVVSAARSLIPPVPLDTLALQLGSNRNAIYKTMFDARRKLRAALVANGYIAHDTTGDS